MNAIMDHLLQWPKKSFTINGCAGFSIVFKLILSLFKQMYSQISNQNQWIEECQRIWNAWWFIFFFRSHLAWLCMKCVRPWSLLRAMLLLLLQRFWLCWESQSETITCITTTNRFMSISDARKEPVHRKSACVDRAAFVFNHEKLSHKIEQSVRFICSIFFKINNQVFSVFITKRRRKQNEHRIKKIVFIFKIRRFCRLVTICCLYLPIHPVKPCKTMPSIWFFRTEIHKNSRI